MSNFCIRYIHDTITLFKMNNAQWKNALTSAAFSTNRIRDSLSLSTDSCMHTTHWFICLHKRWGSTAVSEKKLVQRWFTVIIIMYQITHLSLSTGLFLQCIDSGGSRRLERGTFEFGQNWFQPSFRSCYVQFYRSTAVWTPKLPTGL